MGRTKGLPVATVNPQPPGHHQVVELVIDQPYDVSQLTLPLEYVSHS